MEHGNYRPPGRGMQFEVNAPAQISLRDWIAGQVCAAMLTGRSMDGGFPHVGRLASTAYEVADAMLAEREGGEHANR